MSIALQKHKLKTAFTHYVSVWYTEMDRLQTSFAQYRAEIYGNVNSNATHKYVVLLDAIIHWSTQFKYKHRIFNAADEPNHQSALKNVYGMIDGFDIQLEDASFIAELTDFFASS